MDRTCIRICYIGEGASTIDSTVSEVSRLYKDSIGFVKDVAENLIL